MSAEFPKNEAAPVESKEDKMARLRAELAALEEPEAPAAAPEAQAEAPAEVAQEQAVETAAAPDPAVAERAAADTAALVATRERLGMPPPENAEQPVAEVTSFSSKGLNNLLGLAEYKLYNPLVAAALEQQGIKDPERQGDTRPESIEKYKQTMEAKALEMRKEILSSVLSNSPETQQSLAQQYFSESGVGQDPGATQEAYRVYMGNFRGTPFGEEFKRLESERLVKAGYAPLGADF
jgi:hypothetical protein